MGNPNWVDGWSQADLDRLVTLREVEKKKFREIAAEMNRPEGTCFHRYTKIVRAREPSPSIVPEEKPRRVPLHEQLGIKTYVHMQAILHGPFDGRRAGGALKGNYIQSHWYRVPVTLAKVFA